MKIKILLLLLLNLSINFAFSQGWEWRTNAAGTNLLKDAVNNVYVFRSSQYPNPDYSSLSAGFTIRKYNSNGTFLWSINSTTGMLSTCKIDVDSNLILIGNLDRMAIIGSDTLVPNGTLNFFIAKISPAGNLLSANVYGGYDAHVSDLFICQNGDYLIGGGFRGNFDINGYNISTSDTLINAFLIRLSNTQNVQWSETSSFTSHAGYGVSSEVDQIVELNDGRYYAVLTFLYGYIEWKGYLFSQAGQFLLQLDSSRNINWASYLNYPDLDLCYDYYTDLKVDGDTAFMKHSVIHHGAVSYLKIWHPDGTKKSSQGFGSGVFGYDVTGGHAYYMYAFRAQEGYPENPQYFIGGLNNSGDIIWEDSLLMNQAAVWDISAVSGSEFYVQGVESGYGSGYIGKLNLNLTGIGEHTQNESTINIYPNPSEGAFTLRYKPQGNVSCVRISNCMGQIVFEKICTSQKEVRETINLSDLGKGLYFIQVQSEQASEVKMIVIE